MFYLSVSEGKREHSSEVCVTERVKHLKNIRCGRRPDFRKFLRICLSCWFKIIY